MTDFPRSLLEFQKQFPDEAACAGYLSKMRWPEGFVCPSCGSQRSWKLKTKAFTHECADCRKQTSLTAGTVMHGSKLSLTVWFWAAYLMATHSNGLSALQLQSQLGLGSYKTAWLLAAKLRRAEGRSRASSRSTKPRFPAVPGMILPLAAAAAAIRARSSLPALLKSSREQTAVTHPGASAWRASTISQAAACMPSQANRSLPVRRSRPTAGQAIAMLRKSGTNRTS